MKTKKTITAKKKAIVGAATILGACTLLFGAAAQSVLAAESSVQSTIPTTYPSNTIQQKPDGYVKGNYQVTDQSDADKQPTANEISAQTAADIGAQNLWQLYGDRLDGQTISMYYCQPKKTNERAVWSGWVSASDVGSNGRYHFEVDAVSGAFLEVQFDRILKNGAKNITEDNYVDAELEKDCQAYKDLARALIEQNHLFDGTIKSFRYEGQGYFAYGEIVDPHISISVYSDLNEEIQFHFSRIDKAVLLYRSNGWAEARKFIVMEEGGTVTEMNDNVEKLEMGKYYDVIQEEDGSLYVDYVNDKGEQERLLIGHITQGDENHIVMTGYTRT